MSLEGLRVLPYAKECDRVREHVNIVRRVSYARTIPVNHTGCPDSVEIVNGDVSTAPAFDAENALLTAFAFRMGRTCYTHDQSVSSIIKTDRYLKTSRECLQLS